MAQDAIGLPCIRLRGTRRHGARAHLLDASGTARAQDRVDDLGHAVAVLEGGAQRANRGVMSDRRQHMMGLVEETVAPAYGKRALDADREPEIAVGVARADRTDRA